MATPTPADINFDPTQDAHPNRWNLALPFNLCYVENCLVRSNLLWCSGCRAVMYCGVEHQRMDRPRHKHQCKLIKPARDELAAAEAELRAKGAAALATGSEEHSEEGEREDPFTSPLTRGRFYGIWSTRPYMQKRHTVIQATLNIRTGEAAEAALGHCMEMLQLCRGDNMGVRSQVPGLLLRLGRDQDAYDFLKWWMQDHFTYDWGDNTLPYLDLKGEDAFETVEETWLKEITDVSHLAALTLLKIRLLLDIRMLSQEGNRNPKATYEQKMAWVREDACSNILYSRRDIMDLNPAAHAELAKKLDNQVTTLYRRMIKVNKHYWPALRHPEPYSHARSTAYSPGSREEVIIAFRNTWYMWAECPQAMDLVKTRS
ncbi:hypothetical protein HD806DRAFT_417705 [Xylariaceae sp. AK1471]|nr:hypothetical protein HD806DRAFT_417705 [Xylariaceae sp. AK1471]